MNTPFTFATLTPAHLPGAAEKNDAILGANTYGIEVTVPAFAARCLLGNLDPQHGIEQESNMAAIELAMSMTLPTAGAILVTVRPDLDSVGAMAVLAIRAREMGQFSQPVWERVILVADADKFARGGWPGKCPLPSMANPWPEEGAGASDSRPLAAIAAAVADFNVPMADRVATMETWLLTGEEPASYRAQVERERQDMVAAIASGAIKVEFAVNVVWCHRCQMENEAFKNTPAICPICGLADTIVNTKVVTVVSTHRAAMTVGYALAPVVVALNPAFVFQGGEPHAKFTVAQFEAGYVNLKAATAELASLETGWGGSPTIAGSPQGQSSTLTIKQVVEIVSKHLIK